MSQETPSSTDHIATDRVLDYATPGRRGLAIHNDSPETSFDVVDDELTDADPAIEWAGNELLAGKGFEQVSAALRAEGWSALQAEKVVELARQQTRAARGVMTRNEIAHGAERRYRQTFANMRWIVFGGLPAFVMMVRNVIVSFRAIRDTPSPSERQNAPPKKP